MKKQITLPQGSKMKMLSKMALIAIISLTGVSAMNCTAIYGEGKEQIKLATGSPGELGLLEELAKAFNAKYDSSLCWIKAGSGESLKLLKEKQIDIAMVHAPKAEKEAIKEGWAANRTLIGSNEFYILGPKDDPAGIKNSKNAKEAYSKIAQNQALFYTRADNSGTHKKEMSIWKSANIEPNGKWYVKNQDFMLATLKKADATKGYFMSDSSTYKLAKNELKNLEILYSNDKVLINTYVAMTTENPSKLALLFVKFLSEKEGQDIITNYGKEKYKESLYENAAYAKQHFE
ncbi:ABC transporter substrate-binding protein [Campylobacter upsaliensis]|nr:ABC transporter substrate-binding protein [Campylobacter upsaliensis]EAK4235813.1 ABC transporter substrate-binding protein [Campylobacter upsaliensis]EAK5116029.1 ABC transporter substrate-binding protein [Campylobacter upsaliensis]EAK5389642.1 ABC transporter substrate-binding protein [Campylobacter upsaliensis]